MCVSMTKEILAALTSLTFPAASCCVAAIAYAPSPSGCGDMQAQTPPLETVVWQSTVAPCATVMTASGSPLPENGILVLLVGVGTAASVGFPIEVFTVNAFELPQGVASSPSDSSTSTLKMCGPSASLVESGQAQFVERIGDTMQIACPFSVTSR